MPVNEISIAQLKTRVRIVVGLLLVAVIGISLWDVVAERRNIITVAEHQAEGYARTLAEHSESAFSESDRVLRGVLHSIGIQGGIQKIDRRVLFDELQRQVGDSPHMGSLFIVDNRGSMFINSIQFPSKPIDVADRDYFRYYLNTPGADLSVSRPVMSRLVKRWRFNLMRPLNRPGEQFSGLLTVAFEAEYFKRFFSAASLGPHGRIALLRTDGYPLVFEPYVEKVYETDFSSTVLFREKLPASPTGTFHTTQNHNPIDTAARIVSYQRLSRFPVVAVVSLDKDDVLAPWARKMVLHSGMTLGLCLAVVLLMQLLIRHLDRLQATQYMLSEQEEQVRIKAAQIDAANDAILLLETDGRLVQSNDAFYKLTGYEPADLLGKRLHDVEPPEYAAGIDSNFQFLREYGEMTFESAYLGKDGTVLPVEIHAQVMESGGRKLVLSIARDITERKRSERREQTRLRILEEMATGANLDQLLRYIVQYVEQECEGMLCSVLLPDEDGLHLRHGSAPSLPDFYNQAVDGLRIAEGVGSCGTAAYRRQRVVVEEIEGHPFWRGFKAAGEAGLRACWSEPVISAEGELLGTFATYHREPHSPDRFEVEMIESAVHLTGIAIGRFRSEEHSKQLEGQLHHVQRIEAVGQLAGGIAHDFNNLLTPIIVYADMIQRKLPGGDPLSAKAQGIMNAAYKARDLTRQLLSFGRKQLLTIKPVDLNEIVTTFQDILRRTIRESIIIDVRLAPGGVVVLADRGQMEQILLNLAVNAQDAIKGTGRIIMETGIVALDNEYARLHPGLQPGSYALLGFSDDGCGMNDETLLHMFEPFFTTKQVGHGTGLGLATVYGIVKQHEGYVTVMSHVGEGTTFNIYLPLSKQDLAIGETVAPRVEIRAMSGDTTILVVEDNEMVRTMMVELLESSGYLVLVAGRPSVAEKLVKEHGNRIELMVTDVIMPEMNGQDLYEELLKLLPGLKVLYISGYTNELFVHDGTLEEEINFLQKPFTAERFLIRVQEALGRLGSASL